MLSDYTKTSFYLYCLLFCYQVAATQSYEYEQTPTFTHFKKPSDQIDMKMDKKMKNVKDEDNVIMNMANLDMNHPDQDNQKYFKEFQKLSTYKKILDNLEDVEAYVEIKKELRSLVVKAMKNDIQYH